MKIYGGIYYNEDGISTSVRALHLQTALFNNVTDNVTGFGKVGYQRKEAVVSSFSELIGTDALSLVSDTNIGRLKKTENPLDLALNSTGYFKCKTPNGIKLTKDGRFKLDKNGQLLTLENYKVIGNDGRTIKLTTLPSSLDEIKIDSEGSVFVVNKQNKKLEKNAKIAVVEADGKSISSPNVQQGYVEESNVSLQNEFYELVPVKRNFEANRQLLIMQNTQLSNTISQLGRTS